MQIDEALEFLKAHQPMGPTQTIPQSEIDAYDAALELFIETPDDRCVALFLNSFGEGDLDGVYVQVEDVITEFDPALVLPHLKQALGSPRDSVRYWCAQIAAEFPSADIALELIDIAKSNDFDLRSAAVSALAQIEDETVSAFLEQMSQTEPDPELRALLAEILAHRESKKMD